MKLQAIVILVLVTLFSSFNILGSPLDQQILELKPQADRNKDGKLSDAEKKNLMKTIISRFPRSDSDGDGILSEKEWEVVIRIASVRDKMQKRQNSGKSTNQGQMVPTHTNIKYGEHERNVFDLWLAESKSQPLWRSIFMAEALFQETRKR